MDPLWTRGKEEKISPKISEPFELRSIFWKQMKKPIFDTISNPSEFLKDGLDSFCIQYLHD